MKCCLAVLLSAGVLTAAPVPSRIDADRKALTSSEVGARRTAVLRLAWLGREAEPAVPDLIRALGDEDDVVSHDAANALVRVGAPAAAALGKALSDEQPVVRYRARVALRQLGPDAKDAVPALADRVRNARSVQLRINCALILAHLGPPAKAAIPALKAAACDRASEWGWHRARPSSVCEAAILATRAIDPDALNDLAKAALPTLRDMLLPAGTDEGVLAERYAAVRALALLGPHSEPALADLRTARVVHRVELADFAAACAAMGPKGQKHLMELIADPAEEKALRLKLLQALASSPGLGVDAIKALTNLLTDKDDAIRCTAAWALSAQGAAAEPAVPALIKALADPAFDRLPDAFYPTNFAAGALARVGPKAVPALVGALKDETTRDRAALALGRMGPGARDAVPALRELLAGPPAATSVRAAVALLLIGDAPKEPMRVLLADLGLEALDYLAHRGDADGPWSVGRRHPPPGPEVPPEAVPALLKLLGDESRRSAAAVVLGRMPGSADVIVPEIGKRLRAGGAEERSALLGVYQSLGPAAKEGVRDVLWRLDQDRRESQADVFRTLGAIGPAAKAAAPVLIEAALNPKHPATREAVWALGDLGVGTPEVTDALVKLLRDPADERPGRRDRASAAASALMKLGPVAKRAVPALRAAQLSDYSIIRLEATAALLRIGDEDTSVERLLAAWRDTYDPEESYPVAPHWLGTVELLGPRAEKAVPQLITLLGDPRDRYDEDDRADAARALGAIGPGARAALPRLKELAAGGGPAAASAGAAVRAIEGR